MSMPEQRVHEIIDLFEHLQPSHLPQLHDWYTADVRFKDPFKEVQGLNEVQHIFQHMFEALENPRFVVTTRIVQGDQCFVGFFVPLQNHAARCRSMCSRRLAFDVQARR